jgi:DnaJ-class molecular chaperone
MSKELKINTTINTDTPIKYSISLKPHVCPICDGRGYVPSSFYYTSNTSVNTVTCKTCNGTGIVWG